VTTVAASLWIALANRALEDHTAALFSFYFLVGTIGTGALAGLEQEMTRTVARAHAAGHPVGAAVRHQLRQAVGLATVTVAILAAASPLLVSHWLGGSRALALALLVALAGTWASFLVRGVLAGCQDFTFYSGTLVVQGVAMIVPSLVLTVTGADEMLGYAFAFGLAPLVAAASGLASPALRRSWGRSAKDVAAEDVAAEEVAADHVADAEPGGSPREKLVLLTLATLLSQVLINAVPLIVGPRLAGGDALSRELGKSLSSSMGLSRLALLCLFPLQAPLLPLLAAAAVRGDFREVRRKTGLLVGACLGAGALGVAGVVAIGPWLLRSYFDAHAPLSLTFLAALALSTAFLMTGFVLQSAQVALNRHRVVFVAWLAGLAAMAVVFALPLGPLDAAGWAGIAGPLVVTVIAAADVMFVTRSGPARDGVGDQAAGLPPQPAPVTGGVRP
jgi:O-antigen/teichoic acid export membrane protein